MALNELFRQVLEPGDKIGWAKSGTSALSNKYFVEETGGYLGRRVIPGKASCPHKGNLG